MRTPTRHVAKDGSESWKVRFRLHGKQTSETFTKEKPAKTFAGWIDALGAAAAVAKLNEANQRSDAMLVDEIADMYFAWKAERVKSDRTISDYRRDYDNYIRPVFGHLPADVVTEINVQGWVDTMATGRDWMNSQGEKPSPLMRRLSPKSVADRHALLYAIYGYAVQGGRKLVQYNPCIGTDLPPRTKKPPKGLWPAEWQALRPALVQMDPDGADLADFLLATGWRFSEGAAIGAYAVEDYGDSMYVTMAQVIRRNAAYQHVIVQDAKSEAGEGRRIKIDPEAAAMVRRRLANVKGDGLVFTNANGNQWHYSNFRDRCWMPAVKLAGLSRRPTIHWLRHTHVGWLLIGKETSLPEIQRRIGHESIDTTIGVYGKMADDISDGALDTFAKFRAGALAGPAPREITSS